ncbi:MAG: hypothetical protein RR497_02940 [Oscillospiraceae bacterium]
MKNNDFINSLNEIKPNDTQKEKMLENIFSKAENEREIIKEKPKWFYTKRIVPAFAMLLVIGLTGTAYFHSTNKNSMKNMPPETNASQSDETNNENQSSNAVTGENETNDIYPNHENPTISIGSGDSVSSNTIVSSPKQENNFTYNNANFIILSKEESSKINIPTECEKNDCGTKIGTISKSVDKTLIGCNLYKYKNLNAQGILVVERNNKFELFIFYGFTAYNENHDVDANNYLEMFGIFSANDIKKIEITEFDDQDIVANNTITDTNTIKKYYDFYSVIKDSSKEYFQALSSTSKKPDLSSAFTNGEGGVSPGYEGSAANKLSNQKNIILHAKNGLLYSAPYYPNIAFISRHKVNNEFKSFLNTIIK